jgi:hypothetical protein
MDRFKTSLVTFKLESRIQYREAFKNSYTIEWTKFGGEEPAALQTVTSRKALFANLAIKLRKPHTPQ